MNVLVTGITGFAGSHLAEYLLAEHPEVKIFGTWRWRSRMENIEHLRDRITLLECEMRDAVAVRKALQESQPEAIFHLAAQSFVPASWRAPHDTFASNVQGQTNLFESVRELGLDPTIQIACSSEEYGMVYPDEVPIREDNPLRPLSPYAVSKVAQDLMGYQYFQSYGLKVIRTRGFNHTGPRRGEVFVTSNFAKQIAEIELGLAPPVIRVGNLDAIRDFTDVRDMVRAYWLLLEHGHPGAAYLACSGRSRPVRELIEGLAPHARIPVTFVSDPDLRRSGEQPDLYGSPERLAADTGWAPRIPLETTLADTLDWWRARVADEED